MLMIGAYMSKYYYSVVFHLFGGSNKVQQSRLKVILLILLINLNYITVKKLLLLLLFPILTYSQVIILPSEDNIEIKIDTTLLVDSIKVKMYDLQGKLIQDNIAIVLTTDTEADKDTFKIQNYLTSKGIYIIIIQYNKDILRKLIYNK